MMDLMERNIRAVATKAHSSSTPVQNENQGIATLLVMLAVLTIIVMFCCFSAPGIRGLCKKYFCKCCCCRRSNNNQPEVDTARGTTNTVILLPYGRMLVVDSAVFSQLQADQSGIDLLQLSASLIGQHQGSTPSILDSEETSKGLSPASLGPPGYEEVFLDLPPSYSEVELGTMRTSSDVCIDFRETEDSV